MVLYIYSYLNLNELGDNKPMIYNNPLIKFNDINGLSDFSIGHAQDDSAKTGVSVIYFPNGARAGCDISGGGPASRETPLTSPLTADNPINAIVLSGGSAYGLAASDGVMKCLEDNNIGYNTGAALVPLVCQSCIFDLGYGSAAVRPDSKMGYKACENALNASDAATMQGNVGAGTGATVGKIGGMANACKSGLGICSVNIGEINVTAIVIVNALGDIFNPFDGNKKIAGLLTNNRTEFADTCSALYNFIAPRDMFTGNTTIGAIITNADFNKGELNKIASMTRNAYARCINPVGTMADGDSIYAASTGNIKADINVIGTLSAEVMSAAIVNAIKESSIPDEEFLSNIK